MIDFAVKQALQSEDGRHLAMTYLSLTQYDMWLANILLRIFK